MRLIDADELKKSILKERDAIPKAVYKRYELAVSGIRVALRCMENTPTIDAVPVVSCRDCKHATPISDTEPIYACCCPEVYGIGSRGTMVCDSTHYCSYGERKEDSNG